MSSQGPSAHRSVFSSRQYVRPLDPSHFLLYAVSHKQTFIKICSNVSFEFLLRLAISIPERVEAFG